MMVDIKVFKNERELMLFTCDESDQQKYFERAHSIALNMWNGKDEFSVSVTENKTFAKELTSKI